MIVKIKLRGPLRKYGPDAEIFEHNIDQDRCTVKELLEILNIPASSVSFVARGENKISLDTALKENDLVTVYPRVAGG